MTTQRFGLSSYAPPVPQRVRRFRALAGLFPAPVGETILGLGHAAGQLARGHRPTRGADHDRWIQPLDVRRARHALARGDVSGARDLVARALVARPDNVPALDLRRTIEARQGDIGPLFETLGRLRSIVDGPALVREERRWRGTVTETEPGWLPRLPGPGETVDAHERVVLHLLKESRPHHQTGFTMRSWYTLRSQRDAGLDPVAITSLDFPRNLGIMDSPPVEVFDGLVHHRVFPDRPMAELAPDEQLQQGARLAADILRSVRPSIIHAATGWRGYDQAKIGLALGEHFGLPVVYEVRGFHEAPWATEAAGADLPELVQRRLATEVATMHGADVVVTLAEAMRADIIERGLPAGKVHVVPNAVDTETFQPRPRDPELVRRHGLGERYVVGYVSNLDHPREGLDVLIEAIARLRQRGRRVVGLIVGDGLLRGELEALARRSGAADSIVFSGMIAHDQVPDYYAAIDAFVVPRRSDRAARFVTPLKPYEALAMARPMIIADLPALQEIAPDGLRSLAFRPGDAADLAAKVEQLMDDRALGRRLAEAGRAWVVAERDWRRNGVRYRELFEEVLARRAAGGSGRSEPRAGAGDPVA